MLITLLTRARSNFCNIPSTCVRFLFLTTPIRFIHSLLSSLCRWKGRRGVVAFAQRMWTAPAVFDSLFGVLSANVPCLSTWRPRPARTSARTVTSLKITFSQLKMTFKKNAAEPSLRVHLRCKKASTWTPIGWYLRPCSDFWSQYEPPSANTRYLPRPTGRAGGYVESTKTKFKTDRVNWMKLRTNVTVKTEA